MFRWNHYDSFIRFAVGHSSQGVTDVSGFGLGNECERWWHVVKFSSGSYIALTTKPDGNCMFFAIAQ